MQDQLISIAIDGPVGAGKSTLSDAVAGKLNILHLDTGAMYRAVGLCALRKGISPEDEQGVVDMCLSGAAEVDVQYKQHTQQTLLNGQDVSQDLRTEEVGLAASTVSRYPKVRKYLVERQQAIARKTSILMDGRDIGTVVLPNAPVKIFLTASPEARARRRFNQLVQQGKTPDYNKVLEDLLARDKQDQTRAADPLRQAEDAILLDTSEMDFDASVQAILDIVEAKYGNA